MKSRLVSGEGPRTFILVCDTGDEVTRELLQFVERQGISSAYLVGIGAFQRATLGWFNMDSKQYEHIPVDEQVEVVSLAGNVTTFEGKPRLHAHVVVSKRDGTAHGGHLVEGYVRPTLEVVMVELSEQVGRRQDPEVGLPLIKL